MTVPAAHAQTIGCGVPAESDFTFETLADGYSEMIQMDVAPDGRVFFGEKNRGRVHVYKPGVGAEEIAALSIYTTNNTGAGNRADGLLGIALDPAFATNSWIYVYYSIMPREANINRVSRFTVSRNILTSETVVLDVPTQRVNCCHSAGGLSFDADGNLYVATGDNSAAMSSLNTNATGTSGNTNDLRGKILRVKPLPQGGYSIPAGNLFPAGTDSTRPEIYAMGFRNPFRIEVDPRRGWVLAGDVGPDGFVDTDEFNLIRSPGNYGWPFVQGDQPYSVNGQALDPSNLVNTQANNTGKRRLPAARPPTLWYQSEGTNNLDFPTTDWDAVPSAGRSPAAGPIYYYDPLSPAPHKFPPYFDGKWIVYDVRRRWIKAVTLSGEGGFLSTRDHFAALFTTAFTKVTDVKFGPDGTLYILEYGSHADYSAGTEGAVHRVRYNPPSPECLPGEFTSLAAPSSGRHGRYAHLGPGLLRLPPGARGAALFDGRGRKVWESRTDPAHSGTLAMPASLPRGLYSWRVMP